MADKNPIDDFIDYKTKEAADRANQDLELWNQWHGAGRTPEALKPLMQRYNPLISRRVKEWKAPAVNPTAFKAELQKQFIQAAHNFEPNKGIAFNTYVQRRLEKAKRFNNKYQNVGYIPEEKTSLIGPIQIAQNRFQEDFGRQPTHEELSQHTGISVTHIQNVLSSIRKDVPASSFEHDPTHFDTEREKDVIRLMGSRPQDYFSDDEAKVFKSIYQQGNHSTTELATRFGMSQSRVSRLKTSIGNKIKKNL